MDLSIEQTTLNRALRLVARVAPTKPTLPILQMVLIEAESGRLRLTATDGELGIVTTLPADVTTPGRTAIPARLLGDYVAQLTAGQVQLTLDPNHRRVQVSSARMVANLAALDPQDYPVMPARDEAKALDLDATRFREAIDRVAFAAARDEHRPALAGVLFDCNAEGLTLVATDGFRLARARLSEAVGDPRSLIVPARAVAEFSRVLEGAETARILPTENGRGVYLVARETALFTPLIDGPFPDIGRVIPQEWSTRVTVEKVEFRQAVRAASLFGVGEARPVVLDAAAGRLGLQARSDEIGDVQSELPASMEGEPQAVAVNTRLLAEILDASRGSLLELTWTTPQAPVVVREAGHPEGTDLWMVMPLYDAALNRRQADEAA